MDRRQSKRMSQTAPSPEFPPVEFLPPVPERELFNQTAQAKRVHTTKCNQVTDIISAPETTSADLTELCEEIKRLCKKAVTPHEKLNNAPDHLKRDDDWIKGVKAGQD